MYSVRCGMPFLQTVLLASASSKPKMIMIFLRIGNVAPAKGTVIRRSQLRSRRQLHENVVYSTPLATARTRACVYVFLSKSEYMLSVLRIWFLKNVTTLTSCVERKWYTYARLEFIFYTLSNSRRLKWQRNGFGLGATKMSISQENI